MPFRCLKAALVGGAFAISSAVPAFAQDSVDVPVEVHLLPPVTRTSLTLVDEGVLPSFGQSQTELCVYNASLSRQMSRQKPGGGFTSDPGFDVNGCGFEGDYKPPQIGLTCLPGTVIDLRSQNIFIGGSIQVRPMILLHDDDTFNLLQAGNGGEVTQIRCRSAGNADTLSTETMDFLLDIVVSPTANLQEIRHNATIPLEVIY